MFQNIKKKMHRTHIGYKVKTMSSMEDYYELLELSRKYDEPDIERGLMYRYDYEEYLKRWGY